MRLSRLAAKALRIGATGFGGPMALIGLIENHFVEEGGEVTPEDFAEGVAVGQVLPGPVAVDCMTHIGYRLRGVVGALVGTVALILPATLLMLVVTPVYLLYGEVPQVSGFFKGVAPVVVAIILSTGWRMGKKAVADLGAGAIAALALAGALLGANPALIILVAGLLGMVLCGRRAADRKGD